MKKLYYISLAVICGLISFSCQKVIEEEGQQLNPNVKMIKVSCALPANSTDSKVTLTNDGVSGKIAWEEGVDQVLFHGEYMGEDATHTYSYVATAENVSVDGKTAEFTIPDLDGKYSGGSSYRSSMFAIYPASAAYNYDFEDAWYYISCFKKTNQLMLVACNDTEVNDGKTFKFYNLSGALSFKVAGDFDKYVFQGNAGETVGWDKYSVAFATLKKDGTVETRYCYTGSSGPGGTTGAQTSIEVTPGGTSWRNGSTVNTIFFPGTGPSATSTNAVNFTNGFTIKFYKDDAEVKRISTHTAVTISIGQLLDLGLISSALKDAPPVHNATAPALSGAEDLGATETANCYIVDGSVGSNANKVFKFKAFRGNSSVGVGAIQSVKVLWQTNNAGTDSGAVQDVIAAVDYDKQEANEFYEICFQMPGELHPGNAVIAAYDGPYEAGEPTGNILWSWHIWVPSSTVTSSPYGFYNHPIMDRNLGALVPATTSSVPVESYGLNYQWGRKDPFVGAAATSGSAIAAVKGTAMSLAAGTMTVAESIQNPTQYGVKNGGTWMTTNDNTLWQEGIKTIYDPCPPGYTVMSFDNALPMCGDLSSITGWKDQSGYFTLGSPTQIVFPYAGYRDDSNPGTISSNGSRTAIYTTFTNGSSSSAYHMNVRNGNTHTSGTTSKSRGCSVRCVREEMTSSQVGGITIGTDLTDWNNVQTVVSELSPSSSRMYHVFKATYDDTYLYLYTKRAWKDALWGSTSGYIYYCFDTDYNSATGTTRESAPGIDRYFFLYIFQGSSAAPTIPASPTGSASGCSITGVSAYGVVTDSDSDGTNDYIETEVRILRSNISGLTNGNTVRIYSYSNKDAYNVSARPITIKFTN